MRTVNWRADKTPTTPWRRVLPYAILFSIFASVLAYFWPQRERFVFDDAFITFRYAEHFGSGLGLRWNVGELPTEGFTTPLYVLILAPLLGLGIAPVLAAQLVNCLAVLFSAIILYKASQRWGKTGAYLVPIFYLLNPFTWWNAFSAMETSLFTTLLLLGLYWLEQKPTRALLTLCLAGLARPEGWLIGGLYPLFNSGGIKSENFRKLQRWLLVFALPLSLYLIWKLWYFGQLLPNSFYVKVVQAGDARLLSGAAYVKLFFLHNLPLFFLAGVLLVSRMREARDHWAGGAPILPLAGLTGIAIFYLFPAPLMGHFDRFLQSVTVLALFVIADVGPGGLSNLWKQYGPHESSSRSVILTFSALLLAANLLLDLNSPRGRESTFSNFQGLNDRYVQLSDLFLQADPERQLKIAIQDAGILPYHYDANYFDLVGLNTPKVARAQSVREIIRELDVWQPDVVLLTADPASGRDTAWFYRRAHGRIAQAPKILLEFLQRGGYVPLLRLRTDLYDLVPMVSPSSQYLTGLKEKSNQWIYEGKVQPPPQIIAAQDD